MKHQANQENHKHTSAWALWRRSMLRRVMNWRIYYCYC